MNRILCVALISLLHIHSFGQQWKWALDLNGNSGSDTHFDPAGNIYLLSSVNNTLYGNASLPCGPCGPVIAKHDTVGNIIWARGLGIMSYESKFSVDRLGNVYVIGHFQNSNTFCGGNNPNLTITSTGAYDAFICKYDMSGDLQWANSWGYANAGDYATGIKTDPFGNIFVTGISSNDQQQQYNFFVHRYDTQGNLVWNKDANWMGNMYPTGIDVDLNSNIYITGVFSDTAYFQNITFYTSSPSSVFLAKFDGSGNIKWAKRDGSNYDESNGIMLDNIGNFYIVGSNGNPSTFSNYTLSTGGVFLAKYDTTGVLQWIKNSTSRRGLDIAIDSSNNPIITGYFVSQAVFGNGVTSVTLTSQKNREIFAAKYDKSGNLKWAISPTGSSGDFNEGHSIECDHKNNYILTGQFTETTIFGTTTLNVPNGVIANPHHIFLAKIKEPLSIMTGENKKFGANYIEFNAFPNPTQDILHIMYNSGSNEELNLNIYNTNGILLCSKQFCTNDKILQTEINLSKYARGSYLIEVISGDKRSIKLVVLN